MATKYRLAENLLKVMNQSLKDSKVTMQEAMLYTSQAANKYIRDLIWANNSIGETIVPYGVLRDYDVETKKDSDRNLLYANLPVRSLETLHNNMGIFQVVPCNDFTAPIIPVPKGWMGLYAGRESYSLEGQLAYMPERDKIYIIGADVNEHMKLTITIIPDSTGLAPEDELPLPPEAEGDVIQLALQQLQITIQTPQDLTNDNKYVN